jgi:hypothetical protein
MIIRIIKFFSIFTILAIIFVYVNYFSNFVLPWQKKEIIETTLFWSGLNKFPENAEIIDIEKKGSLFTRQFIIEFKAEKEEIEKWKNSSKRLKNNIPKITLNTNAKNVSLVIYAILIKYLSL